LTVKDYQSWVSSPIFQKKENFATLLCIKTRFHVALEIFCWPWNVAFSHKENISKTLYSTPFRLAPTTNQPF
jgi:hypothetical protein